MASQAPSDYYFIEVCMLVLDSVLLLIFTWVFLWVLVRMRNRQHYQPLKSRSMDLIFIQTTGNMLLFLFTVGNKINSSNLWQTWSMLGQEPENYSATLQLQIYASCFMTEVGQWIA